MKGLCIYNVAMRTQQPFSITSAEEQELQAWLRSTTLPQGQTTRAKIVLSLNDGASPAEVAQAQRVSCKTVHKWRNRFSENGVEGLLDQARPGRPKVIDDKTVKRVLKLTTERIPHESTHWSQRLMAEYAGGTTWQVREIWKAADLKPHRLQTFKSVIS